MTTVVSSLMPKGVEHPSGRYQTEKVTGTNDTVGIVSTNLQSVKQRYRSVASVVTPICMLLGVVANRFPDQTLAWDAQPRKVTNIPEANSLLRRTYRQGFEGTGLSGPSCESVGRIDSTGTAPFFVTLRVIGLPG